MPITTEKELSDNSRSLWLKAIHAVELRNYGYAISLIQNILKEAPNFLDGRKRLRSVEIIASAGKKSFLSGFSTVSLKGAGLVKKDPIAAIELAEKSLESVPHDAQLNHLLKEAAKAAQMLETAAFALETIVQGNPKDTKVMHELAELLLTMGRADDAGNVYTKIVEIDPTDLKAVKNSKDASAIDSMKKGGWQEAKSYRDLMNNKEEAISLEQKSRVVKSVEMIDQQLGELTPEWEAAQQNVDLSRRIARLWEDRFDQRRDEESLEGAYYYYHHTSELTGGADPAVARKLSNLQLQRIDLRINSIEQWLNDGGDQHDEAEAHRDELEALKAEKAGMLVSEARKRVERNPTDLQLRFELGEQLIRAGQFNEAIPELQRAKQNPNARLKAMNLLGQCYSAKGMLDLAIKQYQEAASEMVAMDAVKKEILYSMGLIYERMGKKDESLKCMKDIYEVDAGYKDVTQRVEQSYGP